METYTTIKILKVLYLTKIIDHKKLKSSIEVLKENARYTKDDFNEVTKLVDDYE